MFTRVFRTGWVVVLLGMALTITSAAVFAQATEPASPEAAVEAFYTQYLEASHASDTEPTFPAEGWYHESPLMTERMIAELDAFAEPFDPLLCAQDIPAAFSVEDAELNDAGDAAQVVVRTDFVNYHAFTVNLVQQHERWLLDSVDCTLVEQTPAGVVNQFYLIFLSYNDWDGEGDRPNFVVDGMFQEMPLLSEDYIADIADLLDGDGAGLHYDPLICAQDLPLTIEALESTITGERANVTVGTSFKGHTFDVTLEQHDGNWLITGVSCGRS